MKAIVPVAGYGTRLKPHTDRMQKALLPVAGKATLDYIIDPLLGIGVEEITLITGHLGEQVEAHVANKEGKYNFVFQKERLGLGHAVYQGLEDVDTPLLIHLGDTIFGLDFKAFSSGDNCRIAVGQVEDPRRFGVVELSVGNKITGFYEKHPNPPSNLAISGLYYISCERDLKEAIEYLIAHDIRTKGEYQLTDALDIMLKKGIPFEAYELDSWLDVGVPETYIETNRKLLKTNHGEYEGVQINEPVHIAKGCKITNSIIGPYVTVMENCVIDNCTLVDSIILSDSNLSNMDFNQKIVGSDGSDIC